MQPLSASYAPAKASKTSAGTGRPPDDGGDFLARLIAGEIEATAPEEPPEPDPCPLCHGGHFVIDRSIPRGHPDFAKRVVCSCYEPELRRRRIEAIFGAAEIPERIEPFTFETFAAAGARADQRARVAVETWAATPEPSVLYLHGMIGRGKTGLGYCAFRQIVAARECDCLYRPSAVLLEAIQMSWDHESGGPTTSDVVTAARDVSVLLLDDLGAEKPSAWVIQEIEKLIDHRYNRPKLLTIVTSNFDLAGLALHLSQRISSRLKETALQVAVTGRELREPPKARR